MTVNVDHFDLSGRNAIVIGNLQPAVDALADAYRAANAMVTKLLCSPDEVPKRLPEAIAAHGSVDVLATAFDLFRAQPLAEIGPHDLAEVMMANCSSQLWACQLAVKAMRRQHHGGSIVIVTHVLGERGLPHTATYAAAHGAVHNLIRALAQELAPSKITINGIALGWMDWMTDRIDANDPDGARALRFPIVKSTGRADDIGAMAVWLSADGAGYVTGQIFPLDGGLTQHL